jgi:hypothetical protein
VPCPTDSPTKSGRQVRASALQRPVTGKAPGRTCRGRDQETRRLPVSSAASRARSRTPRGSTERACESATRLSLSPRRQPARYR